MRSNQRKRRTGAIVPMVALLLPVLLVLLGFSVDVAHMQSTRSELRMSTDNAARAAAGVLARTGDMAAARAAATRVAELNLVAGAPLRLVPEDIQFGNSTPNESGRYAFVLGQMPYNSVRVNGRRTADSLSGTVPLYFGSLIGRAGFEPVTSAVASFKNYDICLVLDRSSSMKLSATEAGGNVDSDDARYCSPPMPDSRWGSLDSAVRVFIDVLRSSSASEYVALATYADDISGTSWVSNCGVDSYRTTADATIDLPLTGDLSLLEQEMTAWTNSNFNGKTYIEQGMRRGMDALLSPNARPSAEKVMIVMTDGRQNVGDATRAARDCAAAGIRCHAITYSDKADLDVMRQIAELTGGRYLHTATPEQLTDAFRDLVSDSTALTE